GRRARGGRRTGAEWGTSGSPLVSRCPGVFGFSGLAVLGVFGFSGGRFSVPWVYRSSVSWVAAFGAVVRAGRPRRRGARVRGPARRTGAAGRSRSRIRRRADAW